MKRGALLSSGFVGRRVFSGAAFLLGVRAFGVGGFFVGVCHG